MPRGHEVAIVVGSHRHGSQSRKVAEFVAAAVAGQPGRPKAHMIDLAEAALPFWDEGVWEGDARWAETWGPVSETLRRCGGLVVVSPEWNGMVPSMLTNFFLLCSNNELAHKPAMLVGVSSGTGGSYPVAELRMSSYKNTRICYIPDHVIVRDVQNVLNDEGDGETKADQAIRRRIAYTAGVLMEYVEALTRVRASERVDLGRYPYGM
jgi:NAD(P)H-dependent FMN reductase